MSNSVNAHGASHSSAKSYLIGFIVSIILTAIPFYITINGIASSVIILGVVIVCAILQIVVHLVYFLHLDRKSDGGWNMVAIVFAAIIILIVMVGSLWIMWNLNHNTMVY